MCFLSELVWCITTICNPKGFHICQQAGAALGTAAPWYLSTTEFKSIQR